MLSTSALTTYPAPDEAIKRTTSSSLSRFPTRRPLADTVCGLGLTRSHRLRFLGGRAMRWPRVHTAEVDSVHVGPVRRGQNPTSVWQVLNLCAALPCARVQFFGVD